MASNKCISIIKYTLAIAGLIVFVDASVSFFNTKEFIKTAEMAQGTVVDLHRSKSRSRSDLNSRLRNSFTYAPVVEFQTADGRKITFTSSTSSNPPSYSRGETVDVLYKALSPEQAKIKSFFSLWIGVLIAGMLGLVFFLIGIFIIFLGFKKNRNIEKLKAAWDSR